MATKAAYTTDSKMKSADSFDGHSSSQDVLHGAVEKTTTLTGLKYWVKKLAVETGGIERVTDEERAKNTSKVWNACTFWSAPSLLTSPSPCKDLIVV